MIPASAVAPGVALYIPCYNGAAFLPEVIEALRAQTFPPTEILVVDDASTDGSVAILDRLSREPGTSVRVVRHSVNQGLGAARNTALRETDTPLLASVDADVCPASDWLERVVRALGQADVVGAGGQLMERYQSRPGDYWRATHLRQWHGPMPVRDPLFLSGSNTLYRRQALLDAGGYEVRQRRAGEDISICRRLRERGGHLQYLPDALCTHLRQDTVISALATYWRWKHYANWSPQGGGVRVLRAMMGDATTATGQLVRADMTARRLRNLWADLLYPVVSMSLHLRSLGTDRNKGRL